MPTNDRHSRDHPDLYPQPDDSVAKSRATHRAIETVFRMERARIIAALARFTRNVDLAEEFAQDALIAALRSWPEDGVPDKPGGWLITSARRRAIDHFRRTKMAHGKLMLLSIDAEAEAPVGPPDSDADFGDEMLGLMFVSCHPVLSTEARVALTLRLIGGLTTEEIARAYLVTETAMSQRIVRAKRLLSEAGVPFEMPNGSDRAERLTSVLEVLYLVFNEGYSATKGDDWMRPQLCQEAMRLGRMLASLAPNEAEVHGLIALMEIQASRLPARSDAQGRPILLLDQNRTRWDHLLINRGLAALARAQALPQPGPYTLQAAIAACHARARTAEETDWKRIAALYAALGELAPSPVIELNRAMALAIAFGPAAGLELADQLAYEPALRNYHFLPSVRADLLMKLGRVHEALGEFERAAALTQNQRERAMLLERAQSCRDALVRKGSDKGFLT
ncbi:RNA polymerase sigma factor [Aminobacter sp. AP02]|uniref:RNA polymerase sigma factor n=1 Tax=Aminobacter sp. AP02 TaxID=2135737 RepID=UPI000D6C055A|nr:RNA polymerase sigma factor [Aminobacter sp. AP02]PWK66888.1 RNA polymerase ECF family sigma subunit [Aminobacter sp. AP02]